jgi:hypothetical protein
MCSPLVLLTASTNKEASSLQKLPLWKVVCVLNNMEFSLESLMRVNILKFKGVREEKENK